jgi:hypothetical protein
VADGPRIGIETGEAALPRKAIARIHPPAEPWTVEGWCLYKDDRWFGPTPQEWDDEGWWVYPTREAAFAGLSREMRRRCDEFEAGRIHGSELACRWFPMRVTYSWNADLDDRRASRVGPRGAAAVPQPV